MVTIKGITLQIVHQEELRHRHVRPLPAPWIAVKLNSGKTVVDLIVPEARSEQTKVPLVVMAEGARQEVTAAGDTKACHHADSAAAGADDKIPGTIQPILKGKNSHDVTDE